MGTTKGKKTTTKKATVKKAAVKPAIKEVPIPCSKKVAIVGFAPSRNQAPYDDREWQIWGVNELYHCADVKRIDVLFELHDYKWIKEGKRNKDHLPALQKMKTPIWMQQHFKDIPTSLPFPRKQIEDMFGHYFTNTISWEIALALLTGAEQIGIYGVDMSTDIEYKSQRPSVEWMVGIAQGKLGKDNVYIPPESDLMKCMYQYGFEDGELSIMATKLKAHKKLQQDSITAMQPQVQGLLNAIQQKVGAVATIDYIMNAFVYPNGNLPSEREDT